MMRFSHNHKWVVWIAVLLLSFPFEGYSREGLQTRNARSIETPMIDINEVSNEDSIGESHSDPTSRFFSRSTISRGSSIDSPEDSLNNPSSIISSRTGRREISSRTMGVRRSSVTQSQRTAQMSRAESTRSSGRVLNRPTRSSSNDSTQESRRSEVESTNQEQVTIPRNSEDQQLLNELENLFGDIGAVSIEIESEREERIAYGFSGHDVVEEGERIIAFKDDEDKVVARKIIDGEGITWKLFSEGIGGKFVGEVSYELIIEVKDGEVVDARKNFSNGKTITFFNFIMQRVTPRSSSFGGSSYLHRGAHDDGTETIIIGSYGMLIQPVDDDFLNRAKEILGDNVFRGEEISQILVMDAGVQTVFYDIHGNKVGRVSSGGYRPIDSPREVWSRGEGIGSRVAEVYSDGRITFFDGRPSVPGDSTPLNPNNPTPVNPGSGTVNTKNLPDGTILKVIKDGHGKVTDLVRGGQSLIALVDDNVNEYRNRVASYTSITLNDMNEVDNLWKTNSQEVENFISSFGKDWGDNIFNKSDFDLLKTTVGDKLKEMYTIRSNDFYYGKPFKTLAGESVDKMAIFKAYGEALDIALDGARYIEGMPQSDFPRLFNGIDESDMNGLLTSHEAYEINDVSEDAWAEIYGGVPRRNLLFLTGHTTADFAKLMLRLIEKYSVTDPEDFKLTLDPVLPGSNQNPRDPNPNGYPQEVLNDINTLAERLNLTPDQKDRIQVISYDQFQWIDDCVGWVMSGVSCEPGLVEGYLVNLAYVEDDGVQHIIEFHAGVPNPELLIWDRAFIKGVVDWINYEMGGEEFSNNITHWVAEEIHGQDGELIETIYGVRIEPFISRPPGQGSPLSHLTFEISDLTKNIRNIEVNYEWKINDLGEFPNGQLVYDNVKNVLRDLNRERPTVEKVIAAMTHIRLIDFGDDWVQFVFDGVVHRMPPDSTLIT